MAPERLTMSIIIKFPNDKVSRRIADKRDKIIENIADELYDSYMSVDISDLELSLESITDAEAQRIQSAIDIRHDEFATQIKVILQKAAEISASYCKQVIDIQEKLKIKEST